MRALILALVLCGSVAEAQTVSTVTGTLAHGSTLTISGSSFGTKTTPAPLKYDDFQSVTLAANITTSTATGPAWSNNGGSGQQFNPIASATRLRAGTPYTRNMQSHWQPSGSPDASVSNISLTGQTFATVYLDAWFYNDTSGISGTPAMNVKHVRLHQASAGSPNLGFTDEGPFSGRNFGCAGDDRFDGFQNCGDYLAASSQLYNGWVHYQWLLNANGGGTNSGQVRIYANGTLVYTSNAVVLLNTGFTSWPELYIGNYIRTGDYTGNAYSYWENLYVDTSWARVEVCDSATKAGAHCEIQIPITWSGTSITATVNRGSFSTLNALYLYVCDSANSCSAGKQLADPATGPMRPRVVGEFS